MPPAALVLFVLAAVLGVAGLLVGRLGSANPEPGVFWFAVSVLGLWVPAGIAGLTGLGILALALGPLWGLGFVGALLVAVLGFLWWIGGEPPG
jgi:hypothetical protein